MILYLLRHHMFDQFVRDHLRRSDGPLVLRIALQVRDTVTAVQAQARTHQPQQLGPCDARGHEHTFLREDVDSYCGVKECVPICQLVITCQPLLVLSVLDRMTHCRCVQILFCKFVLFSNEVGLLDLLAQRVTQWREVTMFGSCYCKPFPCTELLMDILFDSGEFVRWIAWLE